MRRTIFFALLAAAHCSAQIKIQTVVNAASFQTGVPAGGSLASIFVSGLSGTPGLITAPSPSPVASKLAGVQVFINGELAPILAVYIPPPGQNAYAQINIQVPIERNVSPDTGKLAVFQDPNQSDMLTPLPLPTWGGFFSDQNGFGVAQHASDYSTVTPENPAHAGEAIIVYANGFFRTWPPPPIGFPTPAQPLFVTTIPYPQFPGQLYLQRLPPPSDPSCPQFAVNTTFKGLAPGLVGVEQINFVVPANQQPGDWDLFFAIPNYTSGTSFLCNFLFRSSYSPAVKLPVR
jgi:uncharacterized protein (TIGR03437 family)